MRVYIEWDILFVVSLWTDRTTVWRGIASKESCREHLNRCEWSLGDQDATACSAQCLSGIVLRIEAHNCIDKEAVEVVLLIQC